MNELIIALLVFLAVMFGLFLACTIHYKRMYEKTKTDKVIFRNLYIRLRDHGLEHVKKHLNVHYMIKYRDEIAEVDKRQYELYKSDE